MTYTLYPHQNDVIDELRQGYVAGHTRQVVGMATGAGKTVVAGQIALNAVERRKRVLFVVHMKQLVIQATDHFTTIGLRVGVLQGENTDFSIDDQVIVASIQTIRSRKAPDWIDLVIIDECHILHEEHIKLMTAWSETPFIGLSATPMREDLGKYFTNLVRGPTVAWLTQNDYLVPSRAFCPGAEHMSRILDGIACKATAAGWDYNEKALGKAMNRKDLVGDIVKTWQEKGENRQTLCFAVNVAHSKAIVDDFLASDVAAAHIDYTTQDAERKGLIGRFRSGQIKILSSVAVLSIGFDVPDASCLILARPTKSEMLDMQQKGRGIRRADGKTDCIMLDHAGNCLVHGLPEHFEVPDLMDNDRAYSAQREYNEPKMVSCSECGYALEVGQYCCPSCGTDRPKPAPNVDYREGKLVEYGSAHEGRLSVEDQMDYYRQLLWYTKPENKARPYKPGWAWRKLIDKTGFKAPRSWMHLSATTPSPEMARWVKSQNIRWAKSQQSKH